MSSSISVLVKGSPTKKFSFFKGLRKCDPLAPFLFNIVVEGLGIIKEAEHKSLYKGIGVGSNQVLVSLL